ncbi:Lft1p LALA0_S09e00716g [Lachancea lanzarotensis]|uniref:LALA0S09e00716g1_1 n=1 Tax=Lachancea lanzarotensis TaxID=1245769 RepID=A0A0C7N714_9SACH|nr:uncharacterized protein LALA0_S09e00716g [Lachancea lanzarotensis]CEP63708.1 LALA0S09e00716g1_1 [Lachancea lanzarotensis]
MDESTSIWNQEASKRDDSEILEKNEPFEDTIEEFKVSDEAVELINIALPGKNDENLKAQNEPTTLYQLLDTAPHGRKVMNDLFARSTGNASIFQHYRKSSIHRNLVKVVDRWIVEREEYGGDTTGSRAASRGDYSSTIFAWSSANREKNIPLASTAHAKDNRPQRSLNQILQKHAHSGIRDFLVQRRELERQREIENLASTTSMPVTPGTFKVDPLLKLEPQALPRPSKKKSESEKQRRKTTKQKNRLSNLFFWKGSSSTKKQTRDEKQTTNEPVSTTAASDFAGLTHSTVEGDQPFSETSADASVDVSDSAFGEFESGSASASGTIDESADTAPPTEASPRMSANLVMESFTPLQPKRRT